MNSRSGDAARVRGVFAALAVCGALVMGAAVARAADHAEAPLVRDDPAADIADVYAWHDPARGTLVAIVTFDGFKEPTKMMGKSKKKSKKGHSKKKKKHSRKRPRGTFDANVRYTISIDNNGDFVPDIQVHTRFARDHKGRWGVMVENLPGARSPVIGPVEKRIKAGPHARVYAGLRDDPFFFDLEGFRTTLMTGTLSFNGNRDTFAGTNATAIVLEMDLAAALGGGSTINLWATTARAGGTP